MFTVTCFFVDMCKRVVITYFGFVKNHLSHMNVLVPLSLSLNLLALIFPDVRE